jgi:hypothetical protein
MRRVERLVQKTSEDVFEELELEEDEFDFEGTG